MESKRKAKGSEVKGHKKLKFFLGLSEFYVLLATNFSLTTGHKKKTPNMPLCLSYCYGAYTPSYLQLRNFAVGF